MYVTVYRDDKGVITITIGERFTFDSHAEFRESYKNEPKNSEYIINLANTRYMDSSALGMLLLLQEHNGSQNIIKLKACNKDLYKIFELVKFDTIFEFI